MNGGNLADWQEVVNGLNERIQAMGQFKTTALEQIPVPTSIDHITQAFIQSLSTSIYNLLFGGNYAVWCDPNRPLVIAGPNDPGWSGIYQSGNYIYGPTRWVPFQVYPYQYQGDFDTRSIYDTIPEFNSIPLRGAELEKVGGFLDWCGSALELLTISARGTVVTDSAGAFGNFSWVISTGEIYDTSDYSAPIGTALTYQDFYTFALNHLTTSTSTGNPYCRKRVYNNGTNLYLSLEYWSCPIRYGFETGASLLTTPGMVKADLTVYYSSFGDDCGFPVNSSSTHIDYSTVAFQNVGPESTVNFGFDISSIATAPAMPSTGNEIEVKENLEHIFGIWDFTNYFHYCI